MPRRSAYTLLEVLLVLAIIVIVSAAGFSATMEMFDGIRAKAASDSVRSAWANARSWSIDEARPYRFAILPGKGNFRVAPDSTEWWNGQNPQGQNGMVMESSLPRGIRFTSDDNAGDPNDSNTIVDTSAGGAEWVHVATFLPDGTAAEDSQVALQYGSARPMVLRLRGLTGTATNAPVEIP
jgi:prepilin-type N-terminal cleavage/methylation domain-containing protein